MTKAQVIYESRPGSLIDVDRQFYGLLACETRQRALIDQFIIPIRSGKAWPVRAGEICRIVVVEGPQVADFNCWNLRNPRERFWAARTKQLHRAHVTTYDRLWSCLPYLRPMATITNDTVSYGIDEDGAGCHDLLGTRCDPYVHKLLNGEEFDFCCHSNLVRAVAPYYLTELDVHDVLNIFQVTGLTKDDRYFVKASPAKRGIFSSSSRRSISCARSRPAQYGPNMLEGILTRWLRGVGERVTKDDELAEVETEKVTAVITAPESGVLEEILITEGQEVAVGVPIARIRIV